MRVTGWWLVYGVLTGFVLSVIVASAVSQSLSRSTLQDWKVTIHLIVAFCTILGLVAGVILDSFCGSRHGGLFWRVVLGTVSTLVIVWATLLLGRVLL